MGGALAAPVTAFQYDWNMLPIGQQLWLKWFETLKEFPPLQAPESYNLTPGHRAAEDGHEQERQRLGRIAQLHRPRTAGIQEQAAAALPNRSEASHECRSTPLNGLAGASS